MKIAVYSIGKNEAQFVERWHASCRDADEVVLLDTGSTDDTVEVARALGVRCEVLEVSPWRFDVARNASLDLVSQDTDLCIALDVDEVLVEGWRAHLEAIPAQITRPRYRYVWSWNPDGTEGLIYGGDKIHARHGYHWRHPVHEVIQRLPEASPEVQLWTDLEIHHHPDHSKPRSQYLPLLELAVREDPEDDRNAFYYARELFFAGRHQEAHREFLRHLALPRARWGAERAASARYLAQIVPHEREVWLLRAAADAPGHREPWVDLAHHYHAAENWPQCFAAAVRALGITERPLEYLNEAEAWGHAPHDLAAVSAWHLGLWEAAQAHGAAAVAVDPADERLRANLELYEASGRPSASSQPLAGSL